MRRIHFYYVVSVALALFTMGFMNYENKTEMDEHPDVDWGISCNDCHAEETPEVFEAWKGSDHGTMNFGCYICHGDGEDEFYSVGSDEGCISCHSEQDMDFEESVFKSCFDCHNGHTLQFHAN